MNDKIDEILEEVVRRFEAIEGVREHFRDPLRDQFFQDIAAAMRVTNGRVLKKGFDFFDPSHWASWWSVFLREYSVIWFQRYPWVVEDPERWEPILEPLWVVGCKLAKHAGTFEPFDQLANDIRAGAGSWGKYDENERRDKIREIDDYRAALERAIDKSIEIQRLAVREAVRRTLAEVGKYDEASLQGKLLLHLKAIVPKVRKG
jgi:hypothetical protein